MRPRRRHPAPRAFRTPGPSLLRSAIALLVLAIAGPSWGALEGPAAAAAQEPLPVGESLPVEREGGSDVAVDRRLARLLEADPLVIASDTTLAPGDTVRRSVLVLDATLIHEGVITGDLVLVDAGAFVRPRSEVGGDLVNVAGGLYRSELARVGGEILDLPLAKYRVVREPDRLVIEASGTESPLVLDDFYGFHAPLYDRVNGVTAVWGASYRFPRLGDVTPTLHAQGGWLTERGEPTYEVDLTFDWFATSVFGGHEKGWATNEEWIRGGLKNSLGYAWNGDDDRDYHDVERTWVGAAQRFGDQEKRFFGTLNVRGQVEDAETLLAGQPWHLWGDSVRPNPAIDDGRISSIVAGFDMEWHGILTDFEGWLRYEGARDWQGGDFTFDRIEAGGDWAMQALANHTLEIEFFGQAPLGGDALPRQRWSFVGGSGTLQTLSFAEFRGDRIAYVETKYIIPFPARVALPILGAPDLQLIHATGMAWTADEERDLHQEIGARLQFFGAYVRYMVAPGTDRDADLDFGLSWPFDGDLPWERD